MELATNIVATIDGVFAIYFAAVGRFDLATFLMATGAFVRS